MLCVGIQPGRSASLNHTDIERPVNHSTAFDWPARLADRDQAIFVPFYPFGSVVFQNPP